MIARRTFAPFAFCLLLVAIDFSPVSAANFTVSKTADTNDGICSADCSLREAITAANAAAGTDTITFDPAVFNPDTITLLSELPAIMESVTISGVGTGGVTVSGGTVYRVLTISGGSVTINSLTIADGFTANDGGGVYMTGNSGLTLNDSLVTNSFASGFGGGIYARAGVILTNSAITNNSSVGSGGGIYFNDISGFSTKPLTITNSTISGNVTANSASGGGISIFDGNVTITGSTITDNDSGDGGGINRSGGKFTMIDSTVSDNTATTVGLSGSGGGMFSSSSPTPVIIDSSFHGNQSNFGGAIDASIGGVTLINSTLSGNTATSAGGALYLNGGGMFINSTITNNTATAVPASSGLGMNIGGVAAFQNSIIANNNGANNCSLGFSTVTDNGKNIDNGSSCGFGGGSFPNTNPMLGALALNGGSTRTHLPQTGSPAINAGNNANAVDQNAAALTTDQREAGYPRILGGTVDIGAVEVGCPAFPYTVQAADTFGLINAVTCANSNGTGTNDVINLTDSSYILTVISSADSGLPQIASASTQGTLTINGNGATIQRSNRAGIPQFRLFLVNSGANLTLNGLTLRGGRLDTNSGGAVFNNGTLNLNDSTIQGNSADAGGGLHNFGVATITRSTFTSNTSATFAGAMANTGGTLRLINSTVSGNAANGIDFAGGGGAVDSFTGTPSVLIINSTIANNTAAQTTRSGLWIENGTVTIQNSIVANNGGANNCVITGNLTDSGRNLDNGSTCGFGVTSLSNTNPLLGALTDNGGMTLTHALNSGSPAINAGDNSKAVDHTGAALTTDQRGAGFPRIDSGTVDIGAYEAILPAVQTLNVQTVLQGRTNLAPHSSYVITVHVKVMPQGGGAAFYNQNIATNSNGALVVPNLPPGTYLFSFKGTHTLARQYILTITAGANSKVTDTLLEGDSSDNNGVTIADFSILAGTFGKSSAQVGYDGRADFNGDNAITIADFSLLASNFAKVGDGGVNP